MRRLPRYAISAGVLLISVAWAGYRFEASRTDREASAAIRQVELDMIEDRERNQTVSQQEMEDALNRAIKGCIPLVAENNSLILHVQEGQVVRRDQDFRSIGDDAIVCTKLGDTGVVKDGVVIDVKNVGYDNLINYEKVYKTYLVGDYRQSYEPIGDLPPREGSQEEVSE